MFGDGSLTFREFMMREPLPLATIHEAVLDWLRGREDGVLFGAQAVNAYVDEPRMTQDVDILSDRAEALADALREHLHRRFGIAVRVRSVGGGVGFRVYQVRKPKNRHLVDVRSVETLPASQRVQDVLVLTPVELVCSKVVGMAGRPKSAKGFTDAADIARLLLAFPELKTLRGPVGDRLAEAPAPDQALAAWKEIVAQEILPDDDDAI